jgi:hypothetical protein
MRNAKRISKTILLLAVSLTGAIVCYASSEPRYRYTIEHHHRQLVEENDDVITPTTATVTAFPTTAPPSRHSEPPPEEAAARVEEQHKKEEAVTEVSVEHDDGDDVDGDGDDASASVGKLTAAIDSTTTTPTTLDSSHHHALLSLLFIAMCAGFFITGIPSSIITQCHCVEGMCSDPNSDTNHQLHGSVQKRMNTFNRNIMVGRGGENNRERSSITLGEPYSPSGGLTSKLTDEEGYELGDEVGIEVDEKRGIDPKPRRPIFGSRLFGALPRTPRGLVRREKKSRQLKEVGTNGAVVSDMYVVAEEEERQQVEFQKVP